MKKFLIFVLLISFVFAVSFDDADKAYTDALLEVEQIKLAGLPHDSFDDALAQMDEKLHGENVSLLLERIAILNSSNESDKLALASQLSSLVQASLSSGLPVGANYSFVVEKSQWIKSRKNLAFEAFNLLSELNKNSKNVSEPVDLSEYYIAVHAANLAFNEERFEDIPGLVSRADSLLEDARISAARERAFLRLARRNIVNFVEDYWRSLLIALVAFIFLVIWCFLEIRAFRSVKHVKFLAFEIRTVEESIRLAQEEYYSGKSGASTYKARMDSYRKRLRQLKSEHSVWLSLSRSYRSFSLLSKFF